MGAIRVDILVVNSEGKFGWVISGRRDKFDCAIREDYLGLVLKDLANVDIIRRRDPSDESSSVEDSRGAVQIVGVGCAVAKDLHVVEESCELELLLESVRDTGRGGREERLL